MTLLASWPTVTDDTGDKTSGTIFNKALTDAVKASVEDNVHSLNNTNIKTKDLIDEVVTARGSLANLNARLSGVINPDGTPVTQAGLVLTSQARRSIGPQNFIPNGDFLLWHLGDSSAPAFWALSGGGAPAVARTGTGLGDTQRGKYGNFAAKITFGSGSSAKLTHTVLNTSDFSRNDGLKLRYVTFGAWIKSSIANHARFVVDDGASTEASAYHTGSGNLEWITLTHQMSSSATKLEVYLEVTAAGSAYFANVLGILSQITPSDFWFCPMVRKDYRLQILGAVGTGANQRRVMPVAPGLIQEVVLYANTAPTGQDLIADLNTWDGAAFTSMYATNPKIVAGSNLGGAVPDEATYARRCYAPFYVGGATTAGYFISLDIDQVGSGVAGSDLDVFMRSKEYLRLFEPAQVYNAA